MAHTLQQVLEDALQLTPAEQAKLVDSLITSLDESDPQSDAAWAAEIERRSNDFDAGRVKLISWDQLREDVRREFSSNHG